MTSFILDGTSLPFPKLDLVPLGSAPANKYSVASDWNTVCQASVDMQSFLRGNFLLFMNGDPSTRAGLVLSNGAPVVTANKGSLALDITTPAVYQNQDGAATWMAIGGGGGGMAIGSPVTGGTVGSLLFVGASTFLQQDNANFFVDNTSKRIGIGTAVPGTTLDLASATTTAGLAMRAGSTTAVSAASTGRFRYNEGTNRFQASMNGAAYVDLQTGTDFTLDIGDAIGSSTVGSLLFVGAGNVLQQDNPNIFWDFPNSRLGVGIAAPLSPLHVRGSVVGNSIARVENSSTAGYSSIAYTITGGGSAGSSGYGNSTVSLAHLQGKLFFHTVGPDIVFANATRNNVTVTDPGVVTVAGVAATNSLILSTGNVLVSNGQTQLTRDHATDGQLFMQGTNAGNTQPSAAGFLNQAGSFRSYVGYFPSAYAFVPYRLKTGILSQTGEDVVIGDTTDITAVFSHANNRVGIGLTTPLYSLDVRGATTASKIHFSPTTTDDGGYLVSGQASQALVSGGSHYDGTNFINKATSTSVMDLVLGGFLFYNGTGLTIGAIGSYLMRMQIYPAGGVEIGNSDAATVSAAGFGKIRYTTSGQKFQVSSNGGAYVDLATGSGMAIGGTVTGGTAGSIPYIAAGPVLAQNNAAFNWDNTNLRINVVQTAADPLDGGGAITLQNTLNTSLSQITWRDNAGTFKTSHGHRNLSHPTKPNEHFLFTNTGVAFRLETNNGGFYWMNTADGGFEVSASTSAVSAANTGRIRYTTTGQKFQVSLNGAAYVDLAVGSGMSIGGTITSATAGSVLFAGAAGILQQDNTNFFWNDTDNTLGLGTPSPLSNYRLSVTTIVGGSGIQITGANTASYSGLDFYNSSAAHQGSVGFGNSTVAITHVQSKLFHYSASVDWVFANATRNEFVLGMTTGSTFLQMQNGSSAAVSDASTGRIRYTTTGQKFQVSMNGAAYVDLATGTPTVSVERLSVDGAASPTIDVTYVSGTGTDLTLANGTQDGFLKTFIVTGGTGTITPANLADGDVLTYAATPANVCFRWDATAVTWHVVGSPYNMVTT